MTAQRYKTVLAHQRMESGLCPECGLEVETHTPDIRFWIPRQCSLTPAGVQDRIEQYRADVS